MVCWPTCYAQADGNSTGVGNPPGYCYKEQPAWSLYRESSFGHGTLDLINGTHALWSCKPLPICLLTFSSFLRMSMVGDPLHRLQRAEM